MTALERIAMVDKTIAHEKYEREIAELKKKTEEKILMQKILDMEYRIQSIIKVGEKVRQNNKLPVIDPLYEHYPQYKDKVFVANGWSHRVGFMGHTGCAQIRTEIRYIGFYSGGSFGPWDFYTDGKIVFEEHEDTHEHRTPTIGDMKEFISEFDKFEERFYTWFDKNFGSEEE